MRTTIVINDKLYKLLKQRSLDTGETVSGLVEDAVTQQLLEDAEDIEDALKAKNEPTYSFNILVQTFRDEGLLK